MADTLLLPTAAFNVLGWKRIEGTNSSLYSYVMENNVYTRKTRRPLMIMEVNELDAAATSSNTMGQGRMVAYRRSPDVLKLHRPMPFRFFNPRMENSRRFVVDGMARIGGLEIRRPGAMRYADGISAAP